MLKRILVAAVGIPALLFILCWCPEWASFLLVAALCVIGAHELLAAVLPKSLSKRFWGLAGGIGVLTVWLFSGMGERDLQVVFIWCLAALLLALFAALILEHGKEKGLRFTDLLVILTAGVLIPLALGCLLRLRLMEHGGGLVLIPMVAAFCSDAAALFTGMAVGRHKLIPAVSPHKTREGAVGGLIGGMVGMILFRIVFFLVTEVQLHIGWCLLLGLLGAALGQLGDLVFSCIKRECGIKDYGKLLPGHGGVLDRFDSVIFAAPVIWLLADSVTLY